MVKRLWRDVNARLTSPFQSAVPEPRPLEKLVASADLRHLNRNFSLPRPAVSVVHGGTLKRRAKERLATMVISLFQGYLDEEEAFLAHLVRMQNTLASSYDDLALQVQELSQAIRIEVSRLAERDQLLHELLEGRIDEMIDGESDQAS